ncbi:preprotein translocase subunit SecE [Mycobacterium spongiae]|uniref:Protein translocase subunit SecE n=1 Tax=Mycobacterium spongiae TaxID=886343 RepID=A0A975JVX5_9MYCO|nr:preprotein translocase subunit SecE [Mycobacterium spongiae]QUR66363.1 preprotein translocase subunit SecE [Mycobacterium spongiae]
MSDEGDAADEAVADGADSEDNRDSGGRTALVTKPAARPHRPTGKRSRQRVADADEDVDDSESAEASDDTDAAKEDSGKKATSKDSKKDSRAKTAKKGKPGARPANPIAFVYNYLKQVVGEMRKVIWPNRKQMVTYTSVVLAFLAFMVALVSLADFGLTKLVLLVFG